MSSGNTFGKRLQSLRVAFTNLASDSNSEREGEDMPACSYKLPFLLRDVGLPLVVDLILVKENNQATKAHVELKQTAKIRSLMSSVGLVLSKVKLTFSWKGVTLETG
jgi:hypothetical protein